MTGALRGSISKGDISFSEVKKLLKDDLARFIVKCLFERPEGINIAWVIDTYYRNEPRRYNRKVRMKLYQRVLRRIRRLEELGIVIKIRSRIDSKFLYYCLNENLPLGVINLIIKCARKQNSNSNQYSINIPSDVRERRETLLKLDIDKVVDLPPKHEYRLRAQKLLAERKDLDERSQTLLTEYFRLYLEDVEETRLVFKNKENEEDLLIVPYKVRFNDERRADKFKRLYKHIWKHSAKHFGRGVHITLTVNPELVDDILTCRYVVQREFNRFMTWLKKLIISRKLFNRALNMVLSENYDYLSLNVRSRELYNATREILERKLRSVKAIKEFLESRNVKVEDFGLYFRFLRDLRAKLRELWKDKELIGRLRAKIAYVRFNEYQQNGRIHLHVVVFGIRWVGHENEIAEKYWRLGFVDIVEIINKRGRWKYKQKPKDYDEKVRKYLERKTGRVQDGGSFMHSNASVYFYFNTNYYGISSEDFDDLSGGSSTLDDYDKLQIALHWALNTRIFTYSRFFKLKEKKYESSGLYEFIGCFYEAEIATLIDYYAPPLSAEGIG